jgi:hypothetical protein
VGIEALAKNLGEYLKYLASVMDKHAQRADAKSTVKVDDDQPFPQFGGEASPRAPWVMRTIEEPVSSCLGLCTSIVLRDIYLDELLRRKKADSASGRKGMKKNAAETLKGLKKAEETAKKLMKDEKKLRKGPCARHDHTIPSACCPHSPRTRVPALPRRRDELAASPLVRSQPSTRATRTNPARSTLTSSRRSCSSSTLRETTQRSRRCSMLPTRVRACRPTPPPRSGANDCTSRDARSLPTRAPGPCDVSDGSGQVDFNEFVAVQQAIADQKAAEHKTWFDDPHKSQVRTNGCLDVDRQELGGGGTLNWTDRDGSTQDPAALRHPCSPRLPFLPGSRLRAPMR